MAKGRKTVFRGFDYRHCDDFAAYLEEMARKGWHFREWGLGLVFEKGEPEDAVYAVEVFTDGTEYDTRPEPKTKEFAEYCEAAGWVLVDAKRKFCIFKRIRDDAVPILTDEERLESIVKAMRPEIWRPLLVALMFVAMRWAEYSMTFERYIFSDMHVLITAVWTVLLLIALLRCGQFYLWQHRCRGKLRRGEAVFMGRGRQAFAAGWYGWLHTFIVATQLIVLVLLGETVMAVFFLCMMGAIVLMGALIAKYRPDAVSNHIIQGIVSGLLVLVTFSFALLLMVWESDGEKEHPEVPLTYEHIGLELEAPELRYWDRLENFFGSWVYYNLDYGADYLFYDVYASEYHWVLDRIWEAETEGKANETRTDLTGEWGAEEAFRNGANDYLVRYEDRILILCGSDEEPLTREQIEIIRDKLDLR